MLDIQRYIINAIRTKSPDLRYIRQLMVKEDKSLKVLSPYTTRRKELLEIQDPTVRNPKWSGRKRHAVNIAKPSKAIRVPGQIADVLKAIGDATKDYPYDIAVIQIIIT